MLEITKERQFNNEYQWEYTIEDTKTGNVYYLYFSDYSKDKTIGCDIYSAFDGTNDIKLGSCMEMHLVDDTGTVATGMADVIRSLILHAIENDSITLHPVSKQTR